MPRNSESDDSGSESEDSYYLIEEINEKLDQETLNRRISKPEVELNDSSMAILTGNKSKQYLCTHQYCIAAFHEEKLLPFCTNLLE